jgi:hypothetical protein
MDIYSENSKILQILTMGNKRGSNGEMKTIKTLKINKLIENKNFSSKWGIEHCPPSSCLTRNAY